MDNLQELIFMILTCTINGVSLVTIFANVITMIKSIRRMKKDIKKNADDVQMSKTQIEEAFKEAVLPKTIKLDVSSKIEQPIKQGLAQMQEDNKQALEAIHQENKLILKVLSQFSHVQKLSEADQEQIADIVNDEVVEEVKL